jgi:protein ImuB
MKRVAPHSARSTLALPAALAPEPGAAQLIGEVSEPAEQFGLRAGMRMGEALSRCPELALIPPDPERAERSWEEALRRLEGIGAQVESGLPGEAN